MRSFAVAATLTALTLNSAMAECVNWFGLPCGYKSNTAIIVETMQEEQWRRVLTREPTVQPDPKQEARRVAWELRCKPYVVKGVGPEVDRWVYAEPGCETGP